MDLKTGALVLASAYACYWIISSAHWQYKHYQLNKRAVYIRQPVLPQSVLSVEYTADQETLILKAADATTVRNLIITQKVSVKQVVAVHAKRCFKYGRSHNLLA